jgi:hypothetical protein
MRKITNHNHQLCLKSKLSNNRLIITYYHVWVFVGYKVSKKIEIEIII